MNRKLKIILQWLLLAPLAALILSLASRYGLEHFSPGNLTGYWELFTRFPIGLVMSLMAPWGWLIYGGLILMMTGRRRAGFWCSISGGVIFGLFWPIWAASMTQ